jgi:DNA mismatch repair protein MutL
VHRASRSGIVIIVNHRLVHNRALLTAVDESYRGLIPGGRHGYGVVTVDVPAETLDVNVHPAKREVRFSDERAVFSAVQRACWAALRAAPALGALAPVELRDGFAIGALRIRDGDFANGALSIRDGGVNAGAATVGEGDLDIVGWPVPHVSSRAPNSDAADASRPGSAGPTPNGHGTLPAMLALGQAGSGFLVATAGDTVVLVDPHAAHEKVLYTELLGRWREELPEPSDSQLLLMPVVVECGSDRASRVADEHDFFSRCGFSIEPFGPGAVRCTAVPLTAANADPEGLVTELIERLDERDSGVEERRHRLAALVACHAAVRFGDRLDVVAQQRLLDQLAATPGGTTCPHGRPSVLLLDDAVLRRAFRRPSR